MIVAALAFAAAAPSFECSKASTNVEKMICADEGLAAADRAAAKLYAAVPKSERKNLFGKESDWLADRDRCADWACVAVAYEYRLVDLFIGSRGLRTRDYVMKGNPSGTLSTLDVGDGWSAFFAQAIWIGPYRLTAPENTAHDTEVAGVFKLQRGARAPTDEFDCGWKITRLQGDRWRLQDWPGTPGTACGAVNASVEGVYKR